MRRASVLRVTSSLFYDYLLLAELDGQWKLVNVLWTMNPDAPKRQHRSSRYLRRHGFGPRRSRESFFP